MQGVRKHFGATQALDGVDLSVSAGEVLALIGENGAGKSTLMKVLAGAHPPDGGGMLLDGQPFAPQHPADSRRAGIAMIYQELSLALHLTVMENIALGAEPVRGPFVQRKVMRQRAAHAMAELGRPDISPETPVRHLSTADRQLVEIGRALVAGSRVLVLDEPTSSLARNDVERLFDLIRRLKQRGLALIYISHFLEEVRAVCDRFVVLRNGRSVGSGTPAETPNTEIIKLMVGRDVEELYPRSPRSPGDALLQLDALSGWIKPDQVTLALHRGEVLGIAGIIGSGRTELLRAVFGLDPVRAGRIKVKAYEGAASTAQQWTRGVGMVSEDRQREGLALNLSIAENSALSSMPRFIHPARQSAAARRWIDKLHIRCHHPDQPVVQLSGGNQQKVAVARLLEHDVDVFLLDEPTRGIDVAAKAEIYRLIDQLACAGKAVLLVSSYLPELLGVCDRIAVMCKGRLHPPRRTEELNEHSIMLEATGFA